MSNLPPFRSRLLGDLNSPSPKQQRNDSSSGRGEEGFNSNLVAVLLALLCAVVCVLGLTAMARCAWFRRIIIEHPPPPPPPPRSNKGLKKKVLKALPKQTCTPDDDGECAICLSDFAAGDEIRVLPGCGHGYHVVCIDTWLGKHSSCPSCRLILVGAGSSGCHVCSELGMGSAARLTTPYDFTGVLMMV